MGKGLPRSLGRGAEAQQDIVTKTIAIDIADLDVDGATGVGWGTAVVQGLPEGNILLLGAVANVIFDTASTQAGLVDTWNGDFGIGTTPADDGTLSGGDVDIIPSTAVGPAVAEAAPSARGANATAVMLDNTDGSLEINLSLLVDDANISADNVPIRARGSLRLAYIVMLDD